MLRTNLSVKAGKGLRGKGLIDLFSYLIKTIGLSLFCVTLVNNYLFEKYSQTKLETQSSIFIIERNILPTRI